MILAPVKGTSNCKDDLLLNQLQMAGGTSARTAWSVSRFSQLILFCKLFFDASSLGIDFILSALELSLISTIASAREAPLTPSDVIKQKGSIHGILYLSISCCCFLPSAANCRTAFGERNEHAQSSRSCVLLPNRSGNYILGGT